MNVAINGRDFTGDLLTVIQDMFAFLEAENCAIQIEQDFRDNCQANNVQLPKHTIFSNLHELIDADLAISIGGDGTLLETVSYVGKKEIPILGINMGRLGYLATTKREDIRESLSEFINGNYELDKRTLLSLITEDKRFGNKNFALNEVAILKRDTSSMIRAHISVDDVFLNSYWADGIIVSTPTGSTGYSLSCGGPIVLPGSENLIITPICPHNLTMRPLIIPDKSKIQIDLEGRTKNILISLDSRSESVPTNFSLKVQKAGFKANLVKLKNSVYFNTLREKLNWGKDVRN
ncbi:MAG: NAD kinase [Cytophagales bacterium]